MKPFRERNPVVVGAVSLVVLALLILAALRAQDLPLIGGGDTYYATFEESGGLKVDDEVRLAGVRVGRVESIELTGGFVKVGFTIRSDARFGPETGATIKVKTILGDMFLALEPSGKGQLEEGDTIPVERTTSPYDVVDVFTDLAQTSEDIDTDQLANALTTLSDLTRNTPEEFRAALDGISRLSETVASRDEEINTLLQNVERVSSVLDDRDEDIIDLMNDADILFRALLQRKDTIDRILESTVVLSQELTALVKQSRADLAPALDQLDTVLDVLNKNEENLDRSLQLMGPFYRIFANVFGNGPWWDTYISNLPPIPGPNGGITP